MGCSPLKLDCIEPTSSVFKDDDSFRKIGLCVEQVGRLRAALEIYVEAQQRIEHG